MITRRRIVTALAGLVLAGAPASAHAQWATVAKQYFYPASHNWQFRTWYPAADRLFNAFDYGHAIISEVLLTHDSLRAVPRLEEREYAYITGTLLRNPPRLPIEEAAVMLTYVRLAPEAKFMFEWAHVLHRQVYDILADRRLTRAQQDSAVDVIWRFYRARRDLAFSPVPKSMALMQEQWYSLAFRNAYPKMNGLIWAYHWLQMGLYEPLVVGKTEEDRQAGVATAVARFRQMLDGAPEGFPVVMPMTPAIAPAFTERFPHLAAVFDNLHSMHDVVSDILANPAVPSGDKRRMILEAGRAYRDDTTEAMTVPAWKRMAVGMGIENQGGPAVGLLPALPTPTMARGAVMRHDKDGNPVGGTGPHAHHHQPVTQDTLKKPPTRPDSTPRAALMTFPR
jgi:hypothetical protein